MSAEAFKAKVMSGEVLGGTFVKTPSVDIVEVLKLGGLDFLCFDAEHAPFDRTSLNACAAVARASGLPFFVRVPSSDPSDILAALDLGANGIVVPHVTDAQTAARVAKAARFGHGGRGYAGSTRWAGFGTSTMPDLLARSQSETIVIAQIEDPEGVDACEAIAATDGVDALFLGPADLSVAYGKTNQISDELKAAMARVGTAAKEHGKAYMTFSANAQASHDLMDYGFTVFFVASEHAWILQGARALMAGLKDA